MEFSLQLPIRCMNEKVLRKYGNIQDVFIYVHKYVSALLSHQFIIRLIYDNRIRALIQVDFTKEIFQVKSFTIFFIKILLNCVCMFILIFKILNE